MNRIKRWFLRKRPTSRANELALVLSFIILGFLSGRMGGPVGVLFAVGYVAIGWPIWIRIDRWR